MLKVGLFGNSCNAASSCSVSMKMPPSSFMYFRLDELFSSFRYLYGGFSKWICSDTPSRRDSTKLRNWLEIRSRLPPAKGSR